MEYGRACVHMEGIATSHQQPFITPWNVNLVRPNFHYFKRSQRSRFLLETMFLISKNKNTMCAMSLQSCPTPCDPMGCSLPASPVHEDSLGKNTGVGCQFFLQGIFPTQISNPGLLHCQQILYQLSYNLKNDRMISVHFQTNHSVSQ